MKLTGKVIPDSQESRAGLQKGCYVVLYTDRHLRDTRNAGAFWDGQKFNFQKGVNGCMPGQEPRFGDSSADENIIIGWVKVSDFRGEE